MLTSRLVTFPKPLVAASIASWLLAATATAGAASLQKLEQAAWGIEGLPSYVNMYVYVPDAVAAKPPIIVGSHYCTGNATAYYSMLSDVVTIANSNGFMLILPEATGRNCWDVGSEKALTRDGKGDTHAIAQMVRYAIATYNADPDRVYAVGTSSGAMMTQALLSLYPDLFRAGVEYAGVPFGCWSAGYDDSQQWSTACATGTVTKTAAEWGDLVRAAYPDYTGHRPRLQLWHGKSDTAINFNNFGESLKEFTNVLGLSDTPTSTDNPLPNYEHQIWTNACGSTVLESTAVTDGTHNLAFSPATALKFFGLLKANDPDPENTNCGGAGGASGAGGAGGASGEAAVAGSGAEAGSSDSTGTTSGDAKSDSGCGCRVAGHRRDTAALIGVLGALALAGTRRRRK